MPKFLPICQIQIWTSSFFHSYLMPIVRYYRERNNRCLSVVVVGAADGVPTDR